MLEIDPLVAFQVTLVFEVLLTSAVNCWVFPEPIVVLGGFTLTWIGAGAAAEIVTVAVPTAVGLETLAAVIVAVTLELTCGAVYSPALEIEPTLACQVTAVFVAWLTATENC